MTHRYAPLQGQQATQHDREVEMQAAFDYSDDEDEGHDASEDQPLNPTTSSTSVQPARVPGTYNFESVDYDYPPPGSPPRPTSVALPNDFGNSNGLIPAFNQPQTRGPHRMWFQRAAASLLPSSVLDKMGLASQRPSGPFGGGTNNDGVFANVTAKPSAPERVQDGDDTLMVPEDVRTEVPPSYAAAQADAVPPYWETTVHAPFAPDSIGDMIIDNLPTGSFFSFCWNLLVSISFQFVGFLLTYLLHTSHAARLGSRAGLGVTLIQYGFALRSRIDSTDNAGDRADWKFWNSDSADGVVSSAHTPVTAGNMTWPTPVTNVTSEQANTGAGDATTEWLSFFLMTVGWFVLLTSLLGFWRVKRWERGIIASQRDSASRTNPTPRTTIVSQLESSFGLRGMSRTDFFRQGFGFGPSRPQDDEEAAHAARRAEEGDAPHSSRETDPMISLDPADPRSRAIIQAFANERRLQQDLREAGLL